MFVTDDGVCVLFCDGALGSTFNRLRFMGVTVTVSFALLQSVKFRFFLTVIFARIFVGVSVVLELLETRVLGVEMGGLHISEMSEFVGLGVGNMGGIITLGRVLVLGVGIGVGWCGVVSETIQSSFVIVLQLFMWCDICCLCIQKINKKKKSVSL